MRYTSKKRTVTVMKTEQERQRCQTGGVCAMVVGYIID